MIAKPVLLAVSCLVFAVSISASAQTVGRVRVVRTAAVLEQPVGEAKAVATVNAGDVFEVLDERDTWVLVRPPNGDGARQWRTGWLNRASVEPLGGAAAANPPPSTPPPQPAASIEPPPEGRKGFIIGFGAGIGMHRTPTFSVFDRFGRAISTGGGENKIAVATDFNVGYAPTDQFLVYYSNKAAFTTDDRVDAVGVTGGGVTYMFRPTSPSAFVNGSVGVGATGSFINGSGGETGAGFTFGGGYEFARHLSLHGDAIFVRLSNGQNHAVYTATFHFLFY